LAKILLAKLRENDDSDDKTELLLLWPALLLEWPDCKIAFHENTMTRIRDPLLASLEFFRVPIDRL
jgi:hypothetical protein